MSELAYMDSVDQVRNNLLQTTIGVLRNWVFDREEPFTIIDLYMDTTISEKLCLNREMLRTVQTALLKLNCTITRCSDLLDDEFLFHTYQPPKIVRIDRDLLVS